MPIPSLHNEQQEVEAVETACPAFVAISSMLFIGITLTAFWI
jgi:hypothetical protein